eukprot:GDKJ01017492.1.p1 GENE.GDKJ01017492.1~~GDKJ01017492.1.p1  ORF type:complete len:113 (+),score=23.75 GDKJ01017492.1:707-1045(+)
MCEDGSKNRDRNDEIKIKPGEVIVKNPFFHTDFEKFTFPNLTRSKFASHYFSKHYFHSVQKCVLERKNQFIAADDMSKVQESRSSNPHKRNITNSKLVDGEIICEKSSSRKY